MPAAPNRPGRATREVSEDFLVFDESPPSLAINGETRSVLCLDSGVLFEDSIPFPFCFGVEYFWAGWRAHGFSPVL